jgi:hypothetical protein
MDGIIWPFQEGKEMKIMKVLKKIAQIIGEVCSVNAGIDFYAG